jgi:hypothetical protein
MRKTLMNHQSVPDGDGSFGLPRGKYWARLGVLKTSAGILAVRVGLEQSAQKFFKMFKIPSWGKTLYLVSTLRQMFSHGSLG